MKLEATTAKTKATRQKGGQAAAALVYANGKIGTSGKDPARSAKQLF